MWQHGEFVDAVRRLPAAGPVALAWYDPGGFQLVGTIYDGTHPSLLAAASGDADADADADAKQPGRRRGGKPTRLLPVEASAISAEEHGAAAEIRVHAGFRLHSSDFLGSSIKVVSQAG